MKSITLQRYWKAYFLFFFDERIKWLGQESKVDAGAILAMGRGCCCTKLFFYEIMVVS